MKIKLDIQDYQNLLKISGQQFVAIKQVFDILDRAGISLEEINYGLFWKTSKAMAETREQITHELIMQDKFNGNKDLAVKLIKKYGDDTEEII